MPLFGRQPKLAVSVTALDMAYSLLAECELKKSLTAKIQAVAAILNIHDQNLIRLITGLTPLAYGKRFRSTVKSYQ